MKAKITRALTVCAISCFIAWIGGWDFNTRGPIEALWSLITIVIVVIAVCLPWEEI